MFVCLFLGTKYLVHILKRVGGVLIQMFQKYKGSVWVLVINGTERSLKPNNKNSIFEFEKKYLFGDGGCLFGLVKLLW